MIARSGKPQKFGGCDRSRDGTFVLLGLNPGEQPLVLNERALRTCGACLTVFRMNLASDIEFCEDINLLIHRPRGVLNEATVNRIISTIGDLEASREKPFNRFWDTLGADEVELNFRYVIHVSLYRRLTYSGRPLVKSAILANDSTLVHYARLHALITQGSPIRVQIFAERADAADWLDVPVQRLKPGDD
jgi:hypothetical protein